MVCPLRIMTAFWQRSTTSLGITGRWLAILVELQVITQLNARTCRVQVLAIFRHIRVCSIINPSKPHWLFRISTKGLSSKLQHIAEKKESKQFTTRKQSLSAQCDPGFLGTTTNFSSRQPSHTHLCKCCRWWYLGTPAQRMGAGQQCLTTIQPFRVIPCFEWFDWQLHHGRISNLITLGQLVLID